MGIISFLKEKFGADQQDNNNAQFVPFKTDDEAVKYVDDEFRRRQKDKRNYELQWMLNINFLNDNQYCDINTASGALYQQDRAYDWQEMEVYNQIAVIYDTRLAKLKKTRPIPFVRPVGNEVKDVAAAKSSKAILKGLDSNLEMNTRRAMVTAWSEITGCCFVRHRWDTELGSLIGRDEQGEVYEGDIDKDIWNSFEVFPDSSFANGIEGCKSLIFARPMSIEEIWDKWNVQVSGRKVDVFTLDRANIGGGLTYNTTNNRFTITTVENQEIVKELMLLPCRKFPQGLNITVAGGKLLDLKPFIYRVGNNGKYGFPVEMQVCIERPGFFWPVSIIERIIPLQRAYNAVRNRKNEVLNRKSIGNLAVEDDGNVDVEELETEGLYPGKIHLYARGAHAPVFIQNSDSTGDFEIAEKSLREEFAMISGVSPFSSQSLPPTGVISGDAMERLNEADDSRLSLTKENIHAAAIRGWKIDLRIYRQFAKGPRLLRYVGENNQVDLIEWYASDLTSDDIIIDNEDELSQTPAQRRNIIIQLMQYKLFSTDIDPKTRNKIIEMMKLGNWEDVDDIEDLHAAKARRENKLVIEGTLPNFKEYDIHELHIQEHNRFRLDVSYEEFEQANPQLAMMFDIHVQQHEQAIQMKMQQAMMAQQMAAQPAN
jgi:hypothetical protein